MHLYRRGAQISDIAWHSALQDAGLFEGGTGAAGKFYSCWRWAEAV